MKANFVRILHRCWTEKKYGKVRRNGKTFNRNYSRELKNGCGLAGLDIWRLDYEGVSDFHRSYELVGGIHGDYR